ncbi:MAG: hypothetical protein DI538_22275 [Azospira oryzae]|jgi:hypothetical protein|nr:MAG: hypothetical protein DI538_22275 [Azospira oryzae]
MIFRQRFLTSLVILVIGWTQVACRKNLSIKEVKKLDKIVNHNGMYHYQYLSIPDSVSLDNLIALTEKMIPRQKAIDSWDVYTYYIDTVRQNKYAVVMTVKAHSGKDTVIVLQFGQEKSLQQDLAVAMKKQLANSVSSPPDSCAGIWANWANPFGHQIIIFNRKGQSYFSDFMGLPEPLQRDSTEKRVFLKRERDERSTFSSPLIHHTYRYELNAYRDLLVTEEVPGSAEFTFAVYSFLCDCNTRQQWMKP